MIYYICRARHAYTVGVLLSYYGPALDDLMRVLPYERLDLLTVAPGDVLIWTDLDRLTVSETATAAAAYDQIATEQPRVMQLNHPVKSQGRFSLLRRLSEQGKNRFNVYRFDEVDGNIAFPVFIRRESGTSRHAPTLYYRLADLRVAMDHALKSGEQKSEMMVVEFCAKPGLDGKYRKYGIFRIFDEVFPQDCLLSDHWFVKFDYRHISESANTENNQYILSNPHASEVGPVFQQAGIEFGRMDYSVVDGRIQVFEINTNPTFVPRPPSRNGDADLLDEARSNQRAFIALDRQARERAGIDSSAIRRGTTNQIENVHNQVMAEVRARADRRHRRRQVKGFLSSIGKGFGRAVTGRLGRSASAD